MTTVQPGSIPLSDSERHALATIKDVLGYTRNERGELQVEDRQGATWLIKRSLVMRLPQPVENPGDNV